MIKTIKTALENKLPRMAVDILLLSPPEVISNFTNHNPLFLDIAEDGIIIKDKEKFLADIMLQTREYTKTKGIKRLAGGWQFPVAFRTAVPL